MADQLVRTGHIENLTVRSWIRLNQAQINRLPFVLLSSIDSDRRVSNMKWVTSRLQSNPTWALSTVPLVISGASLVTLVAGENLMTGFDELWIASHLRTPEPPDGAHLVGPRDLGIERPSAILKWIGESQCRLGVGDGIGLNYAIRDLELGSALFPDLIGKS